MSIINEALKKTEQYIQKNGVQDNPPVNVKSGPNPVLLYTLILLVGLFLGNIIFNLLRYKVRPANIPAKTSFHSPVIPPPPAAPAPAPSLVATPPLQPEVSAPNFILNGIFFSDTDAYALINNQIVREDDLIEGFKVGKITADKVELQTDNKTISLSTRR